MTRRSVAGIGALAFSVLTIVALVVASPPGGSYSAHDATKFVAKGHHVAVFVALYLIMLAIAGLICVLAYLRDTSLLGRERDLTARIFWGTGLASAACFAAGWGLDLGNSIAHAYGGKGVDVPPTITYLISELGTAIVWGPGAILLGIALLALTLGSSGVLPSWLRLATLVAGLGGLASTAFFPFAFALVGESSSVSGCWCPARYRSGPGRTGGLTALTT